MSNGTSYSPTAIYFDDTSSDYGRRSYYHQDTSSASNTYYYMYDNGKEPAKLASLREAIRKKIPHWKKSAEREVKKVEKDLEIFKIGQIVENPEGSLLYFKGSNIFQQPIRGTVDRSLLSIYVTHQLSFDENTSTKELNKEIKRVVEIVKGHILRRDARMSEHVQNINRCEVHPIFRIDQVVVEMGSHYVQLKIYWEYGAIRLKNKRRDTRKLVI